MKTFWRENLDITRYKIKNPNGDKDLVLYLNKEQEKDTTNFRGEDGAELEIIEAMPLVEWFANNYKNFGATLEFVTNRSQEGSQFCKGFGGIGGILRYKVDMMALNEYDEQDPGDFGSDDDYI